jgi:predicted O-methyltransferase YrrM
MPLTSEFLNELATQPWRVAKRKTSSLVRLLKWRLLSEVFKLPAVAIDSLTTVPPTEVCEPILEDICMPPFAPKYRHDDLGPLLRIAKQLQPKVICEIGTAYGNLTANLLRNCPEATVVTVNAPQEALSGNLVTYRLNRKEIGRVYQKYGYRRRVTQLLVNSLHLDLGAHLTPGEIDLAVIDGCHDIEFVINDFNKVRRFVAPGGAILLHDTNPSQRGHLAESYRACLLLRKQGFDIKWIKGTWWGYWTNGQPPRVRRTFDRWQPERKLYASRR